ncbi:MAG: antitoxin [Acidimicrobiia bacterium]
MGSTKPEEAAMGIGDMFDKAKDLAEDNPDQVADAIDKAADVADSATGGKATDQIDVAADKAKDFLSANDD